GVDALAAEAGDTVIQVSGLWRLVTRAHAALYRPVVADGVNSVGAWAALGTKYLVIVVTQAESQGQGLYRCPVVFREQGVHFVFLHRAQAFCVGFHAEHAIAQLSVDHLCAHYKVVTTTKAL